MTSQARRPAAIPSNVTKGLGKSTLDGEGARSTNVDPRTRKARMSSPHPCGPSADDVLARNVTTGLEKLTLDAMGVRSTHEITHLRTAYANSVRPYGPGADLVLLAEPEHAVTRRSAAAPAAGEQVT